MPILAADVWRDFETAGVPASGAHKPIKSDIRAWGSALENAGGITAPGSQLVPLFSNGVGVPAAYRAIVGFDLPNPSLTTPGAVFALPGAPGQVLSGIGADGQPDVAATTGTGNIVLSDSPSFTGPIKFGTLNFAEFSGDSMIVYGPDNRLAFQAGGAVNFYKAEIHDFYNSSGTDEFAKLDAKQFVLRPNAITVSATTQSDWPFLISTTWNNAAAFCIGMQLQIINQASSATSRAFQINSGPLGSIELFSIFADTNNPTIILRGNSILAAPPGSPNFIYASPTGLNYVNAAGSAFLTTQSPIGVWGFVGTTSGTHTLAAAAVASGASTFPNNSGELINTGTGFSQSFFGAAVDLNAAGIDIPVSFKLPSGGAQKFRFAGAFFINTGPGAASLTTAQIAVYTGPGGTGTALCLPQGMASIISNSPGTAGAYQNLTTNPAVGLHWFDVAAFSTVYVRVTTAQGAAAAGRFGMTIAPYP